MKDTGAEGQQLGSVVDELHQAPLGQQAPLDRRDLVHASGARHQTLAQLRGERERTHTHTHTVNRLLPTRGTATMHTWPFSARQTDHRDRMDRCNGSGLMVIMEKKLLKMMILE